MRTWAGAVAVLCVLGGCTPVPAAMELREDELEDARDGSFARIPDGEHASEPAAPEPAPIVEPDGTVPRFELAREWSLDECLQVSAHGMPAVDVTGTFVATLEEQWLQLSALHGPVRLRLHGLLDPGDPSTMPVVDELDELGDWPDEEHECRALRKHVRAQIAAANAELAALRWRTLEPLAVEYGNAAAGPEQRADQPVAERPLQVLVQHGELIVRLPGVRVYERHPMHGRSDGSLYAVHGDPETGVVVLTFADCRGESCTCDALFTTEVVRWSPATFAALDARPCADPWAEDGRCHSANYGF